MKTQHTPGPWTSTAIYSKTGNLYGWGIDSIKDDSDHMVRGRICDVRMIVPNHDCATQEANARLISAAPELLQLLADVGQWLEAGLSRGQINRGTANRDGDLVSQIRAALAKATGKE